MKYLFKKYLYTCKKLLIAQIFACSQHKKLYMNDM